MSATRITYPTALVVLAIREGLRYGFDISDRTGLRSGTVYPILRRLEESGLVRSRWESAPIARNEGRPPRRYYELTGAGAAVALEALDRYPRISGILVDDTPGRPSPAPA